MINQGNGDTRRRIVEAATQLFWEKGYGSTSVADILGRAGIHSGSLYHFFPGKQDVLLAVLETYRTGIHDMLLEPAWRGVDDPVDRIFRLLDGYRQALIRTDCSYGCPIGSLALEMHEPDPPVRALLAANFTNWAQAIEQCLEAAGERLTPGTDRRALAEFVLTTMEGAVMLASSHRDVAYFDRAVRQLRDYFDHLLQPARPARRGPQRRNKGTAHA